jgi:hypothetical protein
VTPQNKRVIQLFYTTAVLELVFAARLEEMKMLDDCSFDYEMSFENEAVFVPLPEEEFVYVDETKQVMVVEEDEFANTDEPAEPTLVEQPQLVKSNSFFFVSLLFFVGVFGGQIKFMMHDASEGNSNVISMRPPALKEQRSQNMHELSCNKTLSSSVTHSKKTLKDEDFERFRAENDEVLVVFHVPSSRSQEFLTDVWGDVASMVTNGIKTASVDCTKEHSTCQAYQLTSFPAVLWMDATNVVELKGSRTMKDILNFIDKHDKLSPTLIHAPRPQIIKYPTSPKDVPHVARTKATLDERIPHARVSIIAHTPVVASNSPSYMANSSKNARQESSINKSKRNDTRDVVLKAEKRRRSCVFSSNGIMVKNVQELLTKSTDIRFKLPNKPLLKHANKDDHVAMLDRASFASALGKNGHLFCFFFVHQCQLCSHPIPIWNTYAKSAKNVTIAAVDCLANMEFCLDLNITEFPTLRWYDQPRMKAIDYKDKERTVELFHTFSKRILEKSVALNISSS